MAVIGRIRRDQGALEGGNGGDDVVHAHRPGAAEYPGEGAPVIRPGCHPALHGGGIRQAHFHRVGERPQSLLLQAPDPSVPEQAGLEGGVPHRGRVARAPPPAHARGHCPAVRPRPPLQVMTGGAGHLAVPGQGLVEKQLSPQGDPGRGHGLAGRHRRHLGQGLPIGQGGGGRQARSQKEPSQAQAASPAAGKKKHRSHAQPFRGGDQRRQDGTGGSGDQ